jgi:hypothetical protein
MKHTDHSLFKHRESLRKKALRKFLKEHQGQIRKNTFRRTGKALPWGHPLKTKLKKAPKRTVGDTEYRILDNGQWVRLYAKGK